VFEILLCFQPGVENAYTLVDPGQRDTLLLDHCVRAVSPQASTRVGTFPTLSHLRIEVELASKHCTSVVY
jgi:hypothetical protein